MTTKRRHLTIMIIWAALLVVTAIMFRDRLFPAVNRATRPAQLRTGQRNAETPTPSPATLVGQWQRTDADYILDIKAAGADGQLDAAYLNPRPIHVSKAHTITQAGHVVVVVTLQDRGYPGNMYTLTYDAEADRLGGVYHHRGLGQEFNVVFTRLPLAQSARE